MTKVSAQEGTRTTGISAEIGQVLFKLAGQVEFQEKLVDSIRETLLVLDWDLNVVRANRSFYDTSQLSPGETEGRLVYDLGDRQWDIPSLRKLLENVLSDNNTFVDLEIEHEFATIGRRVMLLNGRRLSHLDLILLEIRDVTDQRRLEEEQEMLMGELHHRIKNVLTTVDAVARRTMRDSRSLREFGQTFLSRIGAMARTQDLLVLASGGNVDMHEILRLELQAHGAREGAEFGFDGPAISLPQEAVQIFAMVVHELSTNAVKHGALASPEGSIDIAWKVQAGEVGETRVAFRWREHRPMIDTSPSRTGYGSRVLEHAFGHTLRGSSRFTLHPDGAEFVADFQL